MVSKDIKLNFVIVGAQKAGTTAIDYYLRQHPQIGMGEMKELHFFDNEEIFSSADIDYNKLHKRIVVTEKNTVYGECTPIYMYWNPSMKRIREYNPEIKIIAILRNPIMRAFSHWNMEINRKAEVLNFFDCILQESERVKEVLPLQHRVYSYVDRGFYSHQLNRIFRLFKREQVLVLKYEDFLSNQENELGKVFDFLEVEKKVFTYNKTVIHQTQYEKEMTPEEKGYLKKLYKDDIEEVESLLGWNCDDWRH